MLLTLIFCLHQLARTGGLSRSGALHGTVDGIILGLPRERTLSAAIFIHSLYVLLISSLLSVRKTGSFGASFTASMTLRGLLQQRPRRACDRGRRRQAINTQTGTSERTRAKGGQGSSSREDGRGKGRQEAGNGGRGGKWRKATRQGDRIGHADPSN